MNDPYALAAYMALWTVVLCNVVLTLALARMVGRLARRLGPTGARIIDPGPEIGSQLASWEGQDILGRPVALTFPRERDLILLYVSPYCDTCRALFPAARSFLAQVREQADGVWIMGAEDRAHAVAFSSARRLLDWQVVAEESLPPRLRVYGTPYVLWIDASGTLKTKGMVNTREHLESLLLSVRGQSLTPTEAPHHGLVAQEAP